MKDRKVNVNSVISILNVLLVFQIIGSVICILIGLVGLATNDDGGITFIIGVGALISSLIVYRAMMVICEIG